ncbi:MAG: ligase-associated DNA damage response endonuclease PdeM [Pleurocapsa minor GSE-CHR-MK-17-07R]|jgi:DNA ligase-associated metallophosphoesterase|nr:ligase-associated DNA damage response endonuclease PdeM [Pleurocapsa minor GSE-CHR-MK 17-07R]
MTSDGSLTITWHGEDFVLLRERAVYWPAQHLLIATDLHLGKDAAFRAHGLPLGADTTQSDLARLSVVIKRIRPDGVVMLGDVFHSHAGSDERTLSAWRSWRASHAQLALTIVLGNHDTAAGPDVLDALRTSRSDEVYKDETYIVKILFRHYPVLRPDTPQMAGHLHPAVVLKSAVDRLKLHAFIFGQPIAVLPAFGEFIDGGIMRLRPGDKVFGITPTQVIAL